MSGTHYIDTGLVGGDEEGRSMLMLHGLGGAAGSWQPQLEAFSTTARCVAWTMPGYGPSAPLSTLTIATLANACAELLDELGVERADVIGHSMGGYVAQELALSHPDRVERLVLVATTAAFGKPGSAFNDEFLGARLAPLDEGLAPGDLAPGVVDALVADGATAEVRADAVASMSQISADAYRQALTALVTWDGRGRLGKIDAETRCIAGDRDTTAPVRAMEQLCGLVPNASLEVIESCGHLVNTERPDAFNSAVARFLHLATT